MENRYANLLIDNKDKLPEPWYDYPVLQPGQYETLFLYEHKNDFIKIHLGQQDGVWTAGCSVRAGFRSNTRAPGRKWGEFSSRSNALLWTLGELEKLLEEEKGGYVPPAVKKAVKTQLIIAWENKHQLKLFEE